MEEDYVAEVTVSDAGAQRHGVVSWVRCGILGWDE